MNKNSVKIIFHADNHATLCVNGGDYVASFHDMAEAATAAMDLREHGIANRLNHGLALALEEWPLLEQSIEMDLQDFFYGGINSHNFAVNLFQKEIFKILYPNA